MGDEVTTGKAQAPRRIVVGVDGSDTAKAALRWAARHAQSNAAVLAPVVVWDFPVGADWSVGYPSNYDPQIDAEGILHLALEEAREEGGPGLTIEGKVIQGHPVPVLELEAKDADLLVVGASGHGAFSGMVLGSVSRHVLKHAPCPVVVVPHPAPQHATV